MYSTDIKEESLKLHVGKDYFDSYDHQDILGNVDFAVAVPNAKAEMCDKEYLLWAEAKQGTSHDIYESFVQLILTIGKARTFDEYLPPKFLGAFDAEKMAFIQYHKVVDVFYQNDFNWNVTPSNYDTKEFQQLFSLVQDILKDEALIYHYTEDDKLLRKFIRQNFVIGKERLAKVRVTKNNFVSIFNRWLSEVYPSIDIKAESLKKLGMVEADFYLADILSKEDYTLHEKLFALLRSNHYDLINKKDSSLELEVKATANFRDGGKAHSQFWSRYQRPPKKEYWGYILERRDLLVPQDIRERKGSFFTPRIWVEKSQEYLAETLGENWQDEYYIWDCCAGTGNLLANLTNKYNVWASTLDEPDVKVMKDQIHHGLNLLESHIFQFDFLNDPFTKLPQGLQDIINDEEKRRHLVVYINPPYAEAGNARQLSGKGENKKDVAVTSKIYSQYLDEIGIAGRELFAQFFIRIYREIPGAVLAEFSKLKILQAPNFEDFRSVFKAKLLKLFLVPADTFDNVKGKFPIGFFIWDSANEECFREIVADVYDSKGELLPSKTILNYDYTDGNIGKWVNSFRNDEGFHLGFMSNGRNDFQNQKLVYFMNRKDQMPTPRGWWITPNNLIPICIFVAVRHCLEATWLNDRDQFLFPNDEWKEDIEFQTDCLIYALLSNANNIQSAEGINHWIPFTESEVNARDTFQSHFMSDLLSGKTTASIGNNSDLFSQEQSTPKVALTFTPETIAVLDAGRALWRYYHEVDGSNPNASLYDIRLHFQGRDKKGRMNSESADAHYTDLLRDLRDKQKPLAARIAEKVYIYGFLK